MTDNSITTPPVPSPRPAEEIRSPVDIDHLVEQLSVQNFRPIRGELYAALSELREHRAEVERLSAELADARAENERLRGELAGKERTITAELSMKTLMSRKWDEDRQAWSQTIGELATAERAVEAVRTELAAVKRDRARLIVEVHAAARRRDFVTDQDVDAAAAASYNLQTGRGWADAPEATKVAYRLDACASLAALSAASPTTSDDEEPS